MRVSMNRWLAVAATAALILGPAQGRVLGIGVKIRPLPAAKLSIDKAIEEEAPFAAVCEAMSMLSISGGVVAQGGTGWGSQEFKVVEVLFGKAEPVDRIHIGFRLTGRAIGIRERVIWIGHTRHMSLHGRLFGVKALPDTPENRQAVKTAASRAFTPWGEAVEGVQVRLRATQSKWNEGADPRLWADIRNQGKRSLLVCPWGSHCELEVDGRWYRQPPYRGTTGPPKPLSPGRQYNDIRVVLQGSWLGGSRIAGAPWNTGQKQLGTLTPGKHTIRVVFFVTAAKNAPASPFKAVSNPIEIEIVATSDEKVDATRQANTSATTAEPTAQATEAKPDDRTTAVRPASAPTFDGKEILDKLKLIDAVYAAAFTASGTRVDLPGWPRKKWKLTMHRGRIALEEEVVEIPKPTATTKRQPPSRHSGRVPVLGPPQKGQFLTMRSTFYVGPTAQAKYDWVGRIPRYGPLDPWPENSPGLATGGNLTVEKPDAITFMLQIRQPLLCLGRGYSKYITEIRDVSLQEDGRLKVVADGLGMTHDPDGKWELVIDPDAEYLVRSAQVVYRGKRRAFTNSGLTRHGPHCVPEKGECEGLFVNPSFEFQSASFEADLEFLKHAKATMQPPYLIHTDAHDQRRTPRLYVQYHAGKLSPTRGKPGIDLD